MMSEGVHSVVDALTGVVLLYGLISSKRKPTPEHRFGFGREIYFWNFIVALMILCFGAGAALLDGLKVLSAPRPITHVSLSLVVLFTSLLVELVSLWFTIFQTRAARGQLTLRAFLFGTGDATILTVLFDDAAAILGLLTAAVGTGLSALLHEPNYDGIASIIIAFILGFVALVLAHASKAFLIGKAASAAELEIIMSSVKTEPSVTVINGLLTVYLAPDQLLVAMSVSFADNLVTDAIESAIAGIENKLRADHPLVAAVFIKPEAPATHKLWRANWYGKASDLHTASI